ncbi:hypothetical protein Slin15195_G122800 [Septoria linicola]|uniref:Uncharacterized protein n=1 Tax=Septoria linicola TaxID=215465 RepID=A0A9Q9B9R9_9PEZI|nr:hypothetical protein Slin14017_G079000 [Septoria linicola]USW58961.1 hypothetical protein Slin15195_G122800 [Septoria linicola]
MDDIDVIDLTSSQNAVVAADASEATRREPCHFWTLPLEIRDTIFEILYGDRGTVRMMGRAYWLCQENSRKRSNRRRFVPKAFPNTIVHDLLVTKQYFEEAIRVWTKRKHFQFGSFLDFGFSVSKGLGIDVLLTRNIRSIIVEAQCWDVGADFNALMPALRHITVNLTAISFHYDNEKCMWDDDFSDVELASHRNIAPFLECRGLRSFTINWRLLSKVLTTTEQAKVGVFQAQVHRLVNDVVSQPRRSSWVSASHTTFRHALEEARRSKLEQTSATPPPEESSGEADGPLHDNDIPETEDALLRLFLTRPQATLAWNTQASHPL